MDPADIAQEYEERFQNDALARHLRNRPIDEGGDGSCLECDQTIDPRRLAAIPMATLCAPCQESADRRRRTLYGGR